MPRPTLKILAFVACAALALVSSLEAAPFLYTGTYLKNGRPVTGKFDFRFTLYNAAAGGSQVGSIVSVEDVTVKRGTYSVVIDFGDVFTGPGLFVDAEARKANSDGDYTPLPNRDALEPGGYSYYAYNAGTAQVAAVANALTLPFDGTANSASTALTISNTGTGGAIYAATSSTGERSAVTGYNNGPERYAAELEVLNTANPRAALYARTAGSGFAVQAEVNSNTTATALFARTTSSMASSLAGQFVGNVQILGTLSKSAGSFKIDHPLDPENKYLYHSFVESPDMKNVYDGVVKIGSDGRGIVSLPDWFEALNRDFRYQLTPIGAAAPNLHVARKVAGNEFTIGGGVPGLEVSWQVTGIRQDAYARAHPISIEEDKPEEERGSLLAPSAFGLPASRGADQIARPVNTPPAPIAPRK